MLNPKVKMVVNSGVILLESDDPVLLGKYAKLIEELPDVDEAWRDVEMLERSEGCNRYEMTRGLRVRMQACLISGERQRYNDLAKLLASVLGVPLGSDFLWMGMEGGIGNVTKSLERRAMEGDLEAMTKIIAIARVRRVT